MKKAKTMKLKFSREIPTTPKEAYEAWLSPKTPGTIWHAAKNYQMNLKVDGLYYWQFNTVHHYGRFTKIKKGSLVEHTWVSPYTEGTESVVNVSFKKKGKGTLMTLIHSNLPDNAKGRAHNEGWNHFMGVFGNMFEE